MLCEKCKQREATVHVTEVYSGSGVSGMMGKHDYCVSCAPNNLSEGAFNLSDLLEGLQDPEKLRSVLRNALPKHTRFPPEAFEFIGDALELITDRAEPLQISAKNLLAGLRELALSRFGKSAKSALANWNIYRTEDFGEIVFAMTAARLLGTSVEYKFRGLCQRLRFCRSVSGGLINSNRWAPLLPSAVGATSL